MNILLINDNPVVSRLLALCTRDEEFILEEVQDRSAIALEQYDIVFIDEGSYEKELYDLSSMLSIGTKILLSTTQVQANDFDMIILKPFLPSQILEILGKSETPAKVSEDISDTMESAEEESKEEIHTTQVLDVDELEKIKALLDSDDEIEASEEELSDDQLEIRKIEAIKEQLIAEGLEIVDEEEIVDELGLENDLLIFSDESDENSKKKEKKSSKKKKKKLDFTEDELGRIEDAVQSALATLKPKKMKKLLKGKEIEISLKLKDND